MGCRLDVPIQFWRSKLWGGGPILFTLGYGTANTSGEVTAHFSWNGGSANLDPPEAVIVEERSIASWTGDSGTCDCGLEVVDSHNVSGQSGDESGLRWTVKENPGASFTLTSSCSMSASVAVAQGSPNHFYGSCSVTYTATPHDVRLVLAGGKLDAPGTSYLIGQRLTGTVDSAYPIASQTWSVSGGDPFKSFDHDYVGGALYSYGHRVNLNSSDLSASSLVCSFAKPASCTVSCQLHLTLPELNPSGGLALTVGKQTSAVAPTSTLVIADGRVQLINPSSRSGAFIGVYNASPPSSPVIGINWTGNATSPSGYGSGGGWLYLQLITLGSNRFTPPTTTESEQCGSGTTWWTNGLDSTYPYEPLDDGVNSLFSSGTDGFAEDHPNFALDAPATSYTASQSFEDYMMFLPPGAGSQLVPLKKFTWSWGGLASWNGTAWSLSSPSHSSTTPVDYPPFPDWGRLVKSSNITFR